jgi:hypothetical protein
MRTRSVAFLAALVVVAVVPAAAIGAKGTNGTATVSLAVGVTPAKAGTSSQPQRVALSYKQSLTANDGSRLANDISQIKVAFAKGFRFDINAVAQCKESVLEDPNQGPTACPAKSIVGTGKATADARPTLPDPIDATVTAFNGMLDTDANGNPQAPVPALLVVAEVPSLGVRTYLPAAIRGSSLVLDFAPADPAMPAAYILRDLSLTLRRAGSANKPYLRAPTSCPKGGWAFSQTVSFGSGLAPVTAKDTVACSSS